MATASSTVELIVEAARATNPLRQVERQTKRVEGQFEKARRSTKRVEAALVLMGRRGINVVRDLEKNTARLSKRFNGLRGTVGKAVIGFVAFKAAQTGIQRAESERRIKLLGERFGEYAGLQNAATQAAEKFKLSQTEANEALANTFARLRPLGVSLDDITSTFNGFRTAAVLGGATAAEASASFTQLSQALGSGALRGDEFRSVSEQAPLVLQAISDETGIAAGELKKYASEGLLTSDIVIKALKRIESEGSERLAQALDGPAAKIKEFQNATENVQVALTETVVPELSKSFVILAEIIEDLKPVIKGVGEFAARILGGVAGTIERIRDPNKLASEKRTAEVNRLMAKGISLRRLTGSGMSNLGPGYAAQELALSAAAGSPSVTDPNKPTSIIKPPGGTAKTDPLASLRSQIDALKEGVSLAKTRSEEEEKQQQLLIDIGNLTAIRTDDNAALVDEAIKLTGELFYQTELQETAAKTEAERKKIAEEAQAAQQKALEAYEKKLEEVDATFRNSVVDGIMAAVEGTKSLSDSLVGVIKQMARLILQQKLMNALKGFSFTSFFGGFFADGGRPPVGRPSIVGERGPELFVPGRSGTIVPNHELGGGGSTSVVVNVDASGTNVEGDEGSSRQLGALVGAAVQNELIKQQRPGGLLSR